MKSVATALMVLLSLPAFGQNSKPVTLRSNLLEQLHTTHDQKDWFVPIDVAVDGLTAEQATWTDGKGNHSVGQLTVSVGASTALTNAGSAWLLMLSGPGGWGEGCQKLHAYVGEAGENCRQIVSHRDFQPTTGFDH